MGVTKDSANAQCLTAKGTRAFRTVVLSCLLSATLLLLFAVILQPPLLAQDDDGTATPTATPTPTPGKGLPTKAVIATAAAAEPTTETATETVTLTPTGKPAAPTPTPRPSATATPNATVRAAQATATPTRKPQPTPRPPAEKVVYLTFDDGPGEWTQPILDVLAEYDAHATFFVLGRQAAAHAEMIEEMYEAGHGIANHTWKHVDLVTVSRAYFEAEVGDTADAIGEEYESKCLRPPYGSRNQSTYDNAERLGYEIALWSIDTGDWRLPGARAIAQEVLNRLHNRAVILMHDGGGDRSQTVAALKILLPRLQEMGYQMRAVCREDPMPQVGDYIVGIPSELDLNTPSAEPLPTLIAESPAASEAVEVGMIETGSIEVDSSEAEIVGDSVEVVPTPAPTATTLPNTPAGSAGAITFPVEDAVVRGRVLIQGFVNAQPAGAQSGTVLQWRLDLLGGESSTELGGGEPTNHVGALGIWDTREASNGDHTLRLEITYADGSIEQQIVDVQVRN